MVSGRQLARNGFGMVHSATTPVIRHIPGGVDEGVGGDVPQGAFSMGVRSVRSATTPVIRHIPGGVERVAGRNAFQRAFSRGMRSVRSATTPIFPRITGVVDEKSLIGVLFGVERGSGAASRGSCSECGIRTTTGGKVTLWWCRKAVQASKSAQCKGLRCTKKVGHKREKDERDQELPCTFFGTDP